MRAIAFIACAVVPSIARVCKPTTCFKGGCPETVVEFAPAPFDLHKWNGSLYYPAEPMQGHYLMQEDFGIFLHGPLFRPKQRKPQDYAPPLYIVGSLTDKIFKITDIKLNSRAGGTITANLQFVAWSDAPSTMTAVPPAYEGGPERLLVAEGNPFVMNPGNRSMSMWTGGVDLIDEDKCTTIFPSGFEQFEGKVVNTVECHPSGFCFFSVWKFYDDSMPLMGNDCLWWCRVNAVSDPTACTDVGIMMDENGNQICHENGKGAVHGFVVGKADATDPNSFDLFLLYTGKGTFDIGESSIWKMKVTVSRIPGGKGAVKTLSRQPWATDLWQKTVQKPHDVGVDHGWIDDDGKYMWIGTFRAHNNGVHMVEYDTGRLVHSIHGIANLFPGKYTYTSGISGHGAWGKPGSVLAVASCEEFGTQWQGGKSAVVLLDISLSKNSTQPVVIV